MMRRAFTLLGAVDVEPLPWYLLSALATIATAAIGAMVTVGVMRYREGTTGRRRSGELIPKSTVDILLAAKDAEIAGKERDIERWMTAAHVESAARQEMAKALNEITDAVEVLAHARQVRARDQEAPNGRQRR